MENPKDQIAQSLKTANNVLVTVSANPSVDQLSSAIGLTLLLNKMGKHATAVFSGDVPSTIEFLEPEKTLEKTTDSLRDFIISLDKSKADKLRYKVEDTMVKIFITPYRTSIGQEDLEFSQGDFNVDAVVALGVKQREQLDQAIVSHGRILHDATVMSLNVDGNSEVGTINWLDNTASSLCEMVMSLLEPIGGAELLDGQMATAFLTGIVAETQRFSNEKTTSQTMNISAKLMSSGANQQLVATKLSERPKVSGQSTGFDPQKLDDLANEPLPSDGGVGSLQISHGLPAGDEDTESEEGQDQIHIDEHGVLRDPLNSHDDILPAPLLSESPEPSYSTTPPSLGGTLTANSSPEPLDPSTDALSLPPVSGPLLTHSSPDEDAEPQMPSIADVLATSSSNDDEQSTSGDMPQADEPEKTEEPQKDTDDPAAVADPPQMLSDLERYVDSPHADVPDTNPDIQNDQEQTPPEASVDPTSTTVDPGRIDAARDAVSQAVSDLGATPAPLEPVAALNANPVNLDFGHDPAPELPPEDNSLPQMTVDGSTGVPNFEMPANLMPTSLPTDNTAGPVQAGSPPPVPPPMMPPSFAQPPAQDSDAMNPLVPPVL